MQHSGNDVYGDFIASIGANAFQIQFVGDFLHGRAVRITCECVKHGRGGQRVELIILLAVDDISKRQSAAVVFALQSIFGETANDFLRKLGGIILRHALKDRFEQDAFCAV